MSNVTNFLLLFLLCLAHLITTPCNSRHISDDNQKEDFQLISKENDQKSSVVSVSSEAAKNGNSLLAENAVIIRARKALSEHDEVVRGPKDIAALGQNDESVDERVSNWKLPKKKRGEQQPGFNLDYVPPKTHPSVHN